MNSLADVWPDFDVTLNSHQALNSFLLLDIQYSAEQLAMLEEGIRAFTAGELDDFSGSGNGYEYICQSDGLYLECLYAGDPLTPITLAYRQVLEALQAWRDLC